ncbi:uncharacterized protein LOC135492897 isoform X1 [Lineus longissimus]|uniref:uncharacterized protein LOC135492897 isoform X1 n=1 Tax=Lineus longissimus TaxID=88925 RepID=UPI002B4F4E1F
MSNQQMDWKDISFRFCPPSVYRDLEAILLVRRNGEKLLAETLGVPRQTIDTAGRRTQSSSKDILDYLKEDGQTTWRTFYSAVGSHHRHDIKTDVLDKPDTQKAILDYYKNSKEYTLKIPPKAPTEVDDPMHHLLTGKDHDEIGRKGNCLPSPSTGTSPTDISVTATTVNIYVSSPEANFKNLLSFPCNDGCPHHGPYDQTPREPVNSGTLMSGVSMEIGAPYQNPVKRSNSNEEENQNKKLAAGGDDMETDGPAGQTVASVGLPNISSIWEHNAVDLLRQEQNGEICKLRVKAEPKSPKREFVHRQTTAYESRYASEQRNGVMNGYHEGDATLLQKDTMQWQNPDKPIQRGRGDLPRSASAPEPCKGNVKTQVPSLGSSEPPNRSQSVVESRVPGINMGPPMPTGGPEPGGTWPKSGLRSTPTNGSQTRSEPRNMQYSEFRRGRLLFLFNACSQKRACAMGRYFYDQFKIGVKLGYWSLKNEGCEEIGQEIMQDVVKSNWIAICLDKPYVQVIRDFEDSREKYRPLPRNKNFNIRYTYALLKAEYQRHGPSAHQILLFYTPDIDLRLLPEWLLNASSQTRYKLPVSSNLLLTEMDQKNLYWIFRQVGLLSDHIGQRSDQARLYKQNVYQ